MATVLQSLGCAPVRINSVEDHIHLLFDLSRTVSVSQAGGSDRGQAPRQAFQERPFPTLLAATEYDDEVELGSSSREAADSVLRTKGNCDGMTIVDF